MLVIAERRVKVWGNKSESAVKRLTEVPNRQRGAHLTASRTSGVAVSSGEAAPAALADEEVLATERSTAAAAAVAVDRVSF